MLFFTKCKLGRAGMGQGNRIHCARLVAVVRQSMDGQWARRLWEPYWRSTGLSKHRSPLSYALLTTGFRDTGTIEEHLGDCVAAR